MKLSSLRPSSISLSAQLLLTFVALVAATAVGLTFAAYRSSLQNLEVAAHRDAATVAQTRDQMLTQLLELRQRRAAGFLLGMESLCGEPASDRGFGWSEECVRTMLREFRTAEHANGALLTFRNRQLSAEGDPIVFSMPAPGTWDILVRGASVDYAMTARRGETVLFIEFDSSDVLPLFTDRSGLGAGGEVFLIDGEGRPLTPLRYTAPNVDLSTAASAVSNRSRRYRRRGLSERVASCRRTARWRRCLAPASWRTSSATRHCDRRRGSGSISSCGAARSCS